MKKIHFLKAFKKSYFIFFVFTMIAVGVNAQETENGNQSEEELEFNAEEAFEESEEFKRNKLALFLGYSWIPQGEDEDTGEKETIFVPSIGFSYEYWFTEKWGIGTYNDIEIVKYKVEKDDENAELERENALSLAVGAVYEILPKWTAIAGGGLDIDKNETLPILHLATEYVILEKDSKELSISFSYNNKKYYDTFSIGLVYGKKF
ncbi:MAG: hypothetical protein V7691_12575 [Galbibacter orientalis]|uniref:hypothetical protein n=1 Tax=Galbibacter orientalis TaxID=453852 RepID=UPI0030011BF4